MFLARRLAKSRLTNTASNTSLYLLPCEAAYSVIDVRGLCRDTVILTGVRERDKLSNVSRSTQLFAETRKFEASLHLLVSKIVYELGINLETMQERPKLASKVLAACCLCSAECVVDGGAVCTWVT